MSKTGTDVIREATRLRRNNAVIAKHLQVSQLVLEQFIASERQLPKEAMQTLTEYLFGDHMLFDPETNLMRTKTPPTLPTAIHPPVAALGPKLRSHNPIDYAPLPDGPQSPPMSTAYRKPEGFA